MKHGDFQPLVQVPEMLKKKNEIILSAAVQMFRNVTLACHGVYIHTLKTTYIFLRWLIYTIHLYTPTKWQRKTRKTTAQYCTPVFTWVLVSTQQ